MTLFIMQGIPGSGKSTRARWYAERFGGHICSTDDFHFIEGEYRWQPQNAAYFHAWNQFEAEYWLARGEDVIVDNTNITQKQAQPYIDLGKKYGAYIIVVRCNNNYGSIHNVPDETIQRMRENLQELQITGVGLHVEYVSPNYLESTT